MCSRFCANLGNPARGVGRDEHDADLVGGRADLLLTGVSYEELRQRRGVSRHSVGRCFGSDTVNGHLVPILPSPLIRSAMRVYEWWFGAGEEGRGFAAS